jgi:septin family protein
MNKDELKELAARFGMKRGNQFKFLICGEKATTTPATTTSKTLWSKSKTFNTKEK